MTYTLLSMATKLASRLDRIMYDRHWSQSDLAKSAGTSPQTVSRWMRDGHEMKSKHGFALQDSSGFCARWILLGEGPMHPEGLDVNDEFPEVRGMFEQCYREVIEFIRAQTKDTRK